MLKLSTKGRYGLRAMIDLARHQDDEARPVMMSDIAKRQELSKKYLHALLTPLKSAGLIRSTRGAKGGYSLARPPMEITLSDILTALEGELNIVDCVMSPTDCVRRENCPAREVWMDLNRLVDNKLRSVTLAQIVATPIPSETGEK